MEPLLTEATIQQPRTASELRTFINQVRDQVRSDSDEAALAYRRRGLYKELVDEIFPLCEFAELAYPPAFRFQLVLGNQGYDALVFDGLGTEVDRLEFARPQDGELQAEAGKQLAAGNAGFLGAPDFDKPLGDLIEFVEHAVRSKARKDYGGITLIFAPRTLPPLESLEPYFDRQVEEIRQLVASHHFTAKRVVLMIEGRLFEIQT